MAKTQLDLSQETQNISLQRDLLYGFISSESNFSGKNQIQQEKSELGEEEDIELSLGLSSNGRFGVDMSSKKLKRSSSIPEFMEDSSAPAGVAPAKTWSSISFPRTYSLPVDTGEEWRRRKEVQSLRRMEAKRKRVEKQRNLRPGNIQDSMNLGEICEDQKIERIESISDNVKQQFKKVSQLPPRPPLVSGNVLVGARRINEKSSEGMNKCTSKTKIPIAAQSEPEFKPATIKKPETPLKNLGSINGVADESDELARKVCLAMPSVTTTGGNPNGKKIHGLLYQCKKGEEIKIVCVCHGSFLSPAEFVGHAGAGSAVANPLKHIVVNPSTLL